MWLLGAYVVGAIPIGYLVARLLGVDIRRRGSGNIGATNVLRTAGWTPAVATLLADVAKGYAATVYNRSKDKLQDERHQEEAAGRA